MSLVPEEKVSFGLYALSVSSLTVARIRKVYNKLDSKAIAKQVSGTDACAEQAGKVWSLRTASGHKWLQSRGPFRGSSFYLKFFYLVL